MTSRPSEATTWVVYRADVNVCSTVSIPQQLYKTAPRGLLATAELLVSRVSRLTRDTDIAILSVRLSVRDVPVLDENGLTILS